MARGRAGPVRGKIFERVIFRVDKDKNLIAI
jgi:hypothetical protein